MSQTRRTARTASLHATPPGAAIGEAPGKILLFGEHAVVYGEPALGFPIRRRVRVDLRPGSGDLRLGELPDGWAIDASRTSASPEALIRRALGPLRTRVDVVLNLGVPPMRGLGSSAAVAIALLRARASFCGHRPPSLKKLVEDALDVETVAHARPSGVDPAICAHGRLVRFVTRGGRRSVRPARVGRTTFFVVGSVGSHGGTAGSVTRIADLRRQDRRLMRSAMATLGQATQTGQKGLSTGDLERVGRAMDLAHGVLSGLGLVAPQVDRTARAMRSAGALGAKMSGAGGAGGAFVAVFSSRPVAERAVQELQDAHAKDGVDAWVEALPESSD